MNGLTWLLYIGGVASSLGGFFTFLGFFFFALTVISFVISFMTGDDSKHNEAPNTVTVEWAKKARYAFLALLIVFGSLASIMPSKETVYAMAASEMGEKIVTNPRVMQTTNKAFEALDHWLDKQITDDKAKEADNTSEK